MSIPNLRHVVEVAASEFGPLDSHEACAEFTGYVVPILHELDANIGHLRKDPGRTNYQGRAVDACLYLATGQAIDLLVGSKVASPQSPARPSWQVEEIARYSASDWIKPVSTAPRPEQPAPVPGPVTPVPVPGTPCQCGEVVELLTAMRLENAARHQDVLGQLHRLTTATARARKFSGSARFIGPIDGEVSGVPV